jgi:GT2 family glycosyltransferase
VTIRWQYPNHDGRINAVIVDWGTPELAAACLDSLAGCNLFQSVATVDAKHLGWSYARSVNATLRAGTGDIVLALNADTRMLEPPTAILDLFDSDPTIAVVGPRQVDSHKMITHGGIFGTNTRPEFRCWQASLADHDEETSDTRDAVTVGGSVYFARRSVWEQLGAFLGTAHFYEETWFSYYARHQGHRVVYTGATTWVHEFNRSPVEPAWRAKVAAESQVVFRAACAANGIDCD